MKSKLLICLALMLALPAIASAQFSFNCSGGQIACVLPGSSISGAGGITTTIATTDANSGSLILLGPNRSGGTASITFGLNGVANYWKLDGGSQFGPVSDNAVDLARTDARVRTVYALALNGVASAVTITGGTVVTFADSSATFGETIQVNGAPRITSGFGSSPSITTSSTDSLGDINIGTGGAATSGVITFASTWPKAPYCMVNDATSIIATRVSATTTALTFTSTLAWIASDHLQWHCFAPK